MDDFLAYYKHELNSLSQHLKEFAEKYPELADKVNLVENPHVSRLVQAFGILHAKLNLALEESFVQFTNSLFDILYPHYNTPLPSFSILALEPSEKLKEPFLLNKGKLLTMKSDDNACTFQVCYNTEILPLEIKQAFCRRVIDHEADNITKSILTIDISSLKEADLSKIKTIRFFIKGLNDTGYLIYKNIINNVLSIKVNNPEDLGNIQVINKDVIKEVGFADNESILPFSDSSFTGYRLITEFFAFTQKFLFFDLDLSNISLIRYRKEWQIHFYLDNEELANLVIRDNFLLNAAPIVNLFPLESDPIKVLSGKTEYQIIMDNKNPTHNKVYSLEKVKIITGDQEKAGAHLFNFNYDKYLAKEGIFWYLTKRHGLSGGLLDKDLYISLVDRDISLNKQNDKYLYVQAYCFNGNLPFDVYLENNTSFKFIDNTIPATKAKFLSRPTKTYRLCENNDQRWNVIAHLSLNHFNLISSNGKDILKEILTIYNAGNVSLNKLLIDNITDVKVTEKIARIKIGKTYQFCKGSLVEICFNSSSLSQGLLYLFFRILEEFTAMYCSINSFIQLLGKQQDGNIFYSGLPRNGTKCLI
jgi:type VI secretion system protein ImpG